MALNRIAAAIIAGLAVLSASAFTDKDVARVLPKLTLEQKARLVVGCGPDTVAPSHYTPGSAGWTYAIAEYGIPALNLADGPVGPRLNPMPWIETTTVYDDNGLPTDVVTGSESSDSTQAQWCTAFPSTTALAASFDTAAARAQGETMGAECAAYGVDVLLSPGINIIRNPLCGRNFEYFSEDPVLVGALATELVKGVQSQGVGTSLKHFVANNQQTGKKFNDARISRRALREIYLRAFEKVVREAKPWTLMTSYNKIAGQYTQTNQELLLSLLRDEWDYDGLVLTDWTVYRPTDSLIMARTGLIMPGREELVQEVIEAVRSGRITEEQLDRSVADVLRLVARSHSGRGWTRSNPDLAAGAALSRRMGAEAMVLLKNNDSTLPLAPGASIAVFGTGAYTSIAGGTGSSNVNKRYIVDIDRGLEEAGFKVDNEVQTLYRDYNANQAALTDSHPGCPEWQKVSYHRPVIAEMDLSRGSNLIARAAARTEAAVVVIARKSGETADRVVKDDFELTADEQTMLRLVCEAYHAKGKPVVAVLNVCGNMETASWRDLPDAIVMAWYPGQECGHAVADVLSGAVDPSGRLPFTMPLSYYDLPSAQNYPFLGQTEGRNFDYTNYAEDIWVGYRYFDASGRPVAYPFGYGLSYTEFSYDTPRVSRHGDKTTVTVSVTNTGSVAGREVVQLYISAPDGKLAKAPAELKGFAKTRRLAPGESETVSITVHDADLASFDEERSAWITDKGTYTARLGHHIGNYIASVPFTVKKETVRPVADILAPVVPVKTITPAPDPLQDLDWRQGTDFSIIGRVYPDSLPIYSRVPEFRKSATREELYKLGQHTSGMAIRFRSDSPKLALRWESRYRNDMTHMASLGTRGADLYYLAPDSTWRFVAPARPMGDPTTWLMIDNMKPEMREYMIHLPLYDGLKSLEIGFAPGSTAEKGAYDFPRSDAKPIVIYGSSIQHGATASRPGMAPSNVIRRELGTDVINLGFSANAHLDYEIAEMMADVDAAVYVLDFVPNALVWEINEKTEKFVKILRDRRPDVPLVFIEDPYFTTTQLDVAYKAAIDAKNEAIKATYDRLVAEGLDNTYYITTDLITTPDGEWSSDSIHYTDLGYRRYCEALLAVLRGILK